MPATDPTTPVPTDSPDVGALADHAVSLATGPAVAIVNDTTEANLRWANNALTTNGRMHRRTLTVVAFAEVEGGTAYGSVTGMLAGPGDCATLVQAAEEAARTSGPAEDAAPLLTPEQAPACDDYDAPPATTGVEVFGAFAPALGRAFEDAEAHDRRLYGFAEHIVATTYLATSTGVRLRHVQPTGRVELNAKATTAEGKQATAWVGRGTTDFTDVDAADLYAQVVTRLGWSDTTVDLPAGRYETLLPPSAIADLLIYALWSASARDAQEGRSAFAGPDGSTRVGERLSSLPLQLYSDPTHPGIEASEFMVAETSAEGIASVFDNGLALRRVDWLRDGVLANLVRTRATSPAGTAPDAVSAMVDNLILDGDGTTSLDQMIASTERGLLLTCLWYIREVDPETLLLTGLTRDGVYLIEHGKIVGAVNNYRFNESPIDLLTRITEVSAAERTLPREWNDWFTRTVMPAVRVPDFNMSTVSQAS